MHCTIYIHMHDAASTLLISRCTDIYLHYHFQQYKPVSQDNRYECVDVQVY
jgi:hypothetical protein